MAYTMGISVDSHFTYTVNVMNNCAFTASGWSSCDSASQNCCVHTPSYVA